MKPTLGNSPLSSFFFPPHFPLLSPSPTPPSLIPLFLFFSLSCLLREKRIYWFLSLPFLRLGWPGVDVLPSRKLEENRRGKVGKRLNTLNEVDVIFEFI